MLVKMLTKTAPGPSLKTSPLSLFKLEFPSVNSPVLEFPETLFLSTWPLGNLSLFCSFNAWPLSIDPFSSGAESDSPCASFGSSGIYSAKYRVTDKQNKRNTTATKKAAFKLPQASQQALVVRIGNHLCQFPLAPAEKPRIFPTAIHEQNIAFAELH